LLDITDYAEDQCVETAAEAAADDPHLFANLFHPNTHHSLKTKAANRLIETVNKVAKPSKKTLVSAIHYFVHHNPVLDLHAIPGVFELRVDNPYISDSEVAVYLGMPPHHGDRGCFDYFAKGVSHSVMVRTNGNLIYPLGETYGSLQISEETKSWMIDALYSDMKRRSYFLLKELERLPKEHE
jgi:hypothetical protein